VANTGEKEEVGWFSQSHSGYNSNPNLSNCPRSSHYTVDLIQTFVVAEVKAKFRTAAPSLKQSFARARARARVCVCVCVCVCVWRKYMPRRFLRRFPRGATLASRGNREFSYNVENGDGKKITLLNYQSCTNVSRIPLLP